METASTELFPEEDDAASHWTSISAGRACLRAIQTPHSTVTDWGGGGRKKSRARTEKLRGVTSNPHSVREVKRKVKKAASWRLGAQFRPDCCQGCRLVSQPPS